MDRVLIMMNVNRTGRLLILLFMASLLSCALDLSFEKRDAEGDAPDGEEAEDGWDGADDDAADPDADDMEETEPEVLPTCGNGELDPGEECDDGNETAGDGCEPGTCLYTCHDDSECNDDNVCNGTEQCNEASHVCVAGENAPAGTSCEDGVPCTTGEICDGEGNCPAVYDDSRCPSGQVCRPECFTSPSGCGTPPESLVLECESPVEPSVDSVCTVTAGTLEDQVPCLECGVESGIMVIDFSDFGDEAGACEQDGWTLVSGDACAASYTLPECAPAAPAACCTNFSSICTDLSGRLVLMSDKFSNCGGGQEEWRLARTFNTTGLSDVSLTFHAGASSTDTADFISVHVGDGTDEAFVLCRDGTFLQSDYNLAGGAGLYFMSIDLPAWADNNPALTVTFSLNSGSNHNILYLDDIALLGWPDSCAPTYRTVLDEGFSGCPDPIPDGWNGWAVTGAPVCPGFECAEGTGDGLGAQAAGSSWTMTRSVDLSDICGDVRLCFDLMETAAGPGESFHVELSTDGGALWQPAWSSLGNMTTDGTCGRLCLSLSGIDGGVAKNPDVRVRFSLASNDSAVGIDEISLSGAACCEAGDRIVLGAVTETPSPGRYDFPVHNTAGSQVWVLVSCTWGGTVAVMGGWDDILFREAP
jgi:cysteine-rich repeat protein